MIRLPRKVLCLDWDRRALRMVVARDSGGRMALEDAHSHRIPPNVDIDDPQSMGAFIQQMLRRHGWRHRRVIVDVPRERAVINTLTLPPTPPDELAAAVRFQALKELPFPVDEAVVDYAVVAREGRNLVTQVLLAAVRSETLARLRETCTAAGLTPARIGLRPYANVVSVLRAHGAAERRVLFVDVGPALTEIDVIRGGTLAFSRSANVTVPISHLREVEDFEDSRVSSRAELEGLAVSDESLEEAEKALSVEITRTLQAYRASDPNAVIDEIVIGGGTGIEPQLLESVRQRFNLPCVLFDPSAALGVSSEQAAKLRSFSAVLGLAWGIGREGQLEVDFLNPKRPVPRGQTLRRRVRIAAVAAGLVAVVGAAWGVTQYRTQKRQLESVELDAAALARKLRGLLSVRNMCEEVQDWAAYGVFLDDLLRLSEAALEPGKAMRVTRTHFTRATANLTMKLLCRDGGVPNEFARALNEAEGGTLYRTHQKTWQPRATSEDDPFAGSVDVTVELLPLQKHLELQKDRRKQRGDRLKGL